MSSVEREEGTLRGPVVEARNWSSDSRGSIHDDATASKLGFRGGTVAGNIHMDAFAPPLVEAFGAAFFERGWLSLYFQNATTDREPVRAFEIAHVAGPVLLDRRYDVRAEVVAVGQSPQTEFLWFDSTAQDEGGRTVVAMRMLLRFMKASSPHYAEADV